MSEGPDLGALYLKHRDAMWRTAFSMLRGSLHQADDVVQSAIVSIVQNPPSGVRNWEAFLVTAVKRKVYDLWKSAPWRHEELAFDPDATSDEREGGDDVGADHAEEVVDRVDREPAVARLRVALGRLDERSAFVVVQVKEQERSVREVADELGLTPSRVSQILSKALGDLKRMMEEGEVGR